MALRLQSPRTVSVLPTYLDPIFSRPYPTTPRVRHFIEFKLGTANVERLKLTFGEITKGRRPTETLDGTPAPKTQAYLGAELCYLQLHAIQENGAIERFQSPLHQNPGNAYQWLGSCRGLLCGPVFYSLGGMHSVCYSDIADWG